MILTLLSTTTVSSASSAAITSNIDSTYDEYMLVLNDFTGNTADATTSWNASTDGGSNYNVSKTTTAFVAYHNESGASYDVVYSTTIDQAGTGDSGLFAHYKTDADAGFAGIIHLYDPSNTTYVKHFTTKGQGMQSNPQSNIQITAGYFNTTSAVNAVNFSVSSGTMSGVIQLYGVA